MIEASPEFGQQAEVCKHFEVPLDPVSSKAKVGVSKSLLEPAIDTPIHGLRHPPESDETGWYLWTGDLSEDDDFFVPLHAGHLLSSHAQIIAYLGLPPGWRFLIHNEYKDVWFDPALIFPEGKQT